MLEFACLAPAVNALSSLLRHLHRPVPKRVAKASFSKRWTRPTSSPFPGVVPAERNRANRQYGQAAGWHLLASMERSDQWREEITLPGYSEIQVAGKGVVYLKRNAAFMPSGVFQ
jgi:hypothetical protein